MSSCGVCCSTDWLVSGVRMGGKGEREREREREREMDSLSHTHSLSRQVGILAYSHCLPYLPDPSLSLLNSLLVKQINTSLRHLPIAGYQSHEPIPRFLPPAQLSTSQANQYLAFIITLVLRGMGETRFMITARSTNPPAYVKLTSMVVRRQRRTHTRLFFFHSV